MAAKSMSILEYLGGICSLVWGRDNKKENCVNEDVRGPSFVLCWELLVSVTEAAKNKPNHELRNRK